MPGIVPPAMSMAKSAGVISSPAPSNVSTLSVSATAAGGSPAVADTVHSLTAVFVNVSSSVIGVPWSSYAVAPSTPTVPIAASADRLPPTLTSVV